MQLSNVLQTFQLQHFSFELFVPPQSVVQQAYQQQQLLDDSTPFPYWAKVWPSAIGLSFFMHQLSAST